MLCIAGFEMLVLMLFHPCRDDMIEVVEIHRRNNGRDPFPLLLSKCKVPMEPNVPPIGKSAPAPLCLAPNPAG